MSYSSPVLELAVEAFELGGRAGQLLPQFEPSPALLEARTEFHMKYEAEALQRIREWAEIVTRTMNELEVIQVGEITPGFAPKLVEFSRVTHEILQDYQDRMARLRVHLVDPRVVVLLDGFTGVLSKAFEEVEALRWRAVSVLALTEVTPATSRTFKSNADAAEFLRQRMKK